MVPQVCKKMLNFANKCPGILVFVCLVKMFYTTNCRLVLMVDVIAIIVLADVIPNVVADVIPLICGRWKATVVEL